MDAKDAAFHVLDEAGKPLHADEITQRMLATGVWQTAGKTPAATVSARLYMDIKARGDASRFVLTAPQTFGLRRWQTAQSPVSTTSASSPASKSKSPKQPALSFTDAAEKILEQFGGKSPMHYRAITQKALELGWLATEGKTPEATLYAQVITEIRRYKKRGENPRFVQHGKGYIGLTRWMGRGLAFEIEQHNRRVRQALRKRLLGISATEFEELIARLLAEIGFEEIEVTKRSNDGGIDVRGTLVVGGVIRTRMAVQAKKWKPKNNVHTPIVQQVRGSLGAHEQGLIITSSDFSPGARKEAARPDAIPVALMNGEELVLLLVEHGIGAVRRTHDLIELAEPEENTSGHNSGL